MTVHTALLQGTRLLENASVAAPRLTAEVLLSHAMRCERVYLFAHPEQELNEVQWLHFGRYLHERLQGKPTQYITQQQEFYGRPFRVTPAVLIPRPETEQVVEVALQLGREARNILDVGAGSGALAITLQLETGAVAWATEISPHAANIALQNAKRLGAQVGIVICDAMRAIRNQSVDLIVANPPYVPAGHRQDLQREVRDWEPPVALFAGSTGLEAYQTIIQDAPRVLRPEGWLVMELGFGCRDHVAALLAGWRDLRVEPDLAGIPRVIAARRP